MLDRLLSAAAGTCGALALLAVLAARPAPAATAPQLSGSVQAGTAEVGPPGHAIVLPSDAAAMRSAPARARLLSRPSPRTIARNRTRRPTTVAPPAVPPTPAPAGGVGRAAPGPAAAAPGDLVVFRDADLRAVLPAGDTSLVGEPCVAASGPAVFVVGNWYAALSGDGGGSFRHIDPATAFPSVNGGFCCDQVAAYEPTRDLFLWLLLYRSDGTAGTVRLAVARGRANLAAGRWSYYDFAPADIDRSGSFDYPKLGLGANDAYVTANVFSAGDVWQGSSVLRLPLDAIAAESGFTYHHHTSVTHFTLVPTSGATTTMYFGAHDASDFATRVFRWSEGSDLIHFDDVPVSAYADENGACPGPVGANWCARGDDRILAAWVADGVIGFLWNAFQGQGHAFRWPYVRGLRVREQTRETIDEPVIYSDDFAWQYPSVAVNVRGHLGGFLFFGGGAVAPTLAAMVVDDVSGATFPGDTLTVAESNRGPDDAVWGDYLCTVAQRPSTTTWLGTGFVLRDGGAQANVHPHVVWMGRERDRPPCLEGDPCDSDASACTVGDACTDAVCAPGPAVDCRAPDACHLDGTCDPATGTCSRPLAPDGTGCDDGQACTDGACRAGTCSGTPYTPATTAAFLAQDAPAPACTGRRDARLARRIARCADRARASLVQATGARRPERRVVRAGRLLAKAARAVARAPATTAVACRTALADRLAAARERVGCL